MAYQKAMEINERETSSDHDSSQSQVFVALKPPLHPLDSLIFEYFKSEEAEAESLERHQAKLISYTES